MPIVALFMLMVSTHARAAELRVVDSGGLLRAVKVVRGKARIVIVLQPAGKSAGGECVATNIDGLAVERRVAVSPQGECSFADMSEGSWQIDLPDNRKWRAQIYE